MAEETKAEVVVIGGGPGGYTAAFEAADLGMDVTIIDTVAQLGGVCLHRGCIPSKTLLHAAATVRQAREAAEWGIQLGEATVDVDKLAQWKNKVVQTMAGGLGGLAQQRQVTVMQGTARFEDARTLHVTKPDGGSEYVTFEHAIIATGSRPVVIPGFPTDSPLVMDSTGALALTDIPASLLVIGGGYIGLELATVYSGLGSEVTVVEMTDRLMLGFDRDLVRVLENRLQSQLASVKLSTKVTSVQPGDDHVAVTLEAADGSVTDATFDKVLVAVGRRPNTENLGLENTGVKVDARGFIEVALDRRTTVPHIFAIGDVTGEPMLAHKASHEGLVAAEAISGRRVAFEPRVIPAVAFTDPEIAACGLSEDQAKAEGRDVKVLRFPWAASGRATTLGRPDGLTKVIVDSETEHVLGVGIVGVGAGELIAEGVVAVEMGAIAEDVKLSIHPHPTLSETVMEAAQAAYGSSTHVYRRQR